jgi:CheY-like chemotaxis protein
VAITARSGGDEEVRSLASGMDAFLRKPFSGAQLAQTLAQVTAWRSAQDAPEHQAGAPAES